MKKLLILTTLLTVSSLTFSMANIENEVSTAASNAITNAVNTAVNNFSNKINATIQSYLGNNAAANTANQNKTIVPASTVQPSNVVEKSPAAATQNTPAQDQDYLTKLIKQALGQ